MEPLEPFSAHTWCRLSRGLGWGLFLALCWILVSTSTFFVERETLWQTWHDRYAMEAATELAKDKAMLLDSVSRTLAAAQRECAKANADVAVLSRYQCKESP